MNYTKPQQKLVSFVDNQADLDRIYEDVENGWSIVSIVKNGNYYVGIMELKQNFSKLTDSIFIPPRKKIKLFS